MPASDIEGLLGDMICFFKHDVIKLAELLWASGIPQERGLEGGWAWWGSFQKFLGLCWRFSLGMCKCYAQNRAKIHRIPLRTQGMYFVREGYKYFGEVRPQEFLVDLV